MLNIRELKELIALMNEHDLTEVEVEHEGNKIKLKKGADGVLMPQMHVQAPQTAQALPGSAASDSTAIPAIGESIKSPMVGTFYSSPAPDADAYVKVGSKIEVGQVICIVEAMKLMNEIKSEIKGTVIAINAQNGEPVEFGQTLFNVE